LPTDRAYDEPLLDDPRIEPNLKDGLPAVVLYAPLQAASSFSKTNCVSVLGAWPWLMRIEKVGIAINAQEFLFPVCPVECSAFKQ
jgi:hypothetical protein